MVIKVHAISILYPALNISKQALKGEGYSPTLLSTSHERICSPIESLCRAISLISSPSFDMKVEKRAHQPSGQPEFQKQAAMSRIAVVQQIYWFISASLVPGAAVLAGADALPKAASTVP